MKPSRLLIFAASLALTTCLMGCKKQQAVDATKPLTESFQSAKPEVQQTIEEVNASLRTGKYEEAMQTLVPLVNRHPMNEAQKRAAGLALRQINQAVAANPALDTKKMYDLRAELFHAIHGKGGF